MESLVRVSSVWGVGAEWIKREIEEKDFSHPHLTPFFFFKADKHQKPQSRKTDLGTN